MIVLNLKTIYVKPHLDYTVQTWGPFYDKDTLLIEQVQKRVTYWTVCDFSCIS